jgi:small subunit ribosomal protein S16
MIVIRLARRGAKKRPFFHVVVADKCCKRDGRFIEKLGYLNPVAAKHEENLRLNMERINYWIKQGANPSHRVNLLMKKYKKKIEAEPVQVSEINAE